MWTTSITPTYNVNLPEKPQTGHGSPRICINPAKQGAVMWEGSLIFIGSATGGLHTIGVVPANS